MTYRVAHLTIKGGHAAQDWPTESLATAEFERLKARDDIVCAVVVDTDGIILWRLIGPHEPQPGRDLIRFPRQNT